MIDGAHEVRLEMIRVAERRDDGASEGLRGHVYGVGIQSLPCLVYVVGNLSLFFFLARRVDFLTCPGSPRARSYTLTGMELRSEAQDTCSYALRYVS